MIFTRECLCQLFILFLVFMSLHECIVLKWNLAICIIDDLIVCMVYCDWVDRG